MSRRSGSHPVVVLHLVAGVTLLGLFSMWVLVSSGAVTGHAIRFLLPVPWVVAGSVGLLALVLRDRRRPFGRQQGWVRPGDGDSDAPHETLVE